MKKFKIIAFIMAIMIMLSACGSDYPVVNRKLDITELMQKCFEGTGMTLDIDDGKITVNCVADQMEVDMDASQKTISKIQQAVKNASVSDDGLTGAWVGTLDMSPVICEIFSDVEGLDLKSYLGGTYIPATLTFTKDGNYTLKFDKDSLDKAYNDVLSKTAKATKAYMQNGVTGAGKLVANAIPANSIEGILVYAVRAGYEILENGASGTYVVKDNKIIFDGNESCEFILNGDILQISKSNTTGVLSSLSAVETETFTKA